jgi:hypothetical protein
MLDDNLGRANGKAGCTFDFLVLDISNKPLHSTGVMQFPE